jgi:hypothetical protein
MLKPYPTLADAGLFLSSLALFPEVYPCSSTARHPRLLLTPNCRFALPATDGTHPPACGFASPAIPQSVADDWDRERQLFIRGHLALRAGEWNGNFGRHMGGTSHRRRQRI